MKFLYIEHYAPSFEDDMEAKMNEFKLIKWFS